MLYRDKRPYKLAKKRKSNNYDYNDGDHDDDDEFTFYYYFIYFKQYNILHMFFTKKLKLFCSFLQKYGTLRTFLKCKQKCGNIFIIN